VSARGAVVAARGRRQGLLNAAKYAVSALLVGVLAWHFQGGLLAVAGVEPWAALAAVALLLLQPALTGLRWLLLLRVQGSTVGAAAAIGITWFGVLANQVLPASVGGDAVRVLALLRRGEALGVALGTVLLDRLLALVALALVMAALLPWLLADTAGWLAPLLTSGGVALCLGLLLARRGIPWLAARLPADSPLAVLLGRIRPMLAVLDHPRIALAALALSLAVHALSLAAFLVLARGLGVQAAALPLLTVGALLIFVQVVPISIGGWGAREAAAVALLGALGVGGDTALGLSILLGLAYATASLPGAATWLLAPMRR
jgi:uncharacterized membrane protein YbhN (UPF0104 family)